MAENLTTQEIDDAINDGIETSRDVLFVREAPETIALVAGTYTYNLSIGAPLAIILSVDIDNEPLPQNAWWIIDANPPQIVLNNVLYPSLSGTLRVQGLGMASFVSNPADEIGVDTDFLVFHACTFLHGTRLNRVREQPDAPQLAALHEQEQARFAILAANAFERAKEAVAIPPTARRVRSQYLS